MSSGNDDGDRRSFLLEAMMVVAAADQWIDPKPTVVAAYYVLGTWGVSPYVEPKLA
jgi:hypothetical protein